MGYENKCEEHNDLEVELYRRLYTSTYTPDLSNVSALFQPLKDNHIP
jgi:hypothetical protein